MHTIHLNNKKYPIPSRWDELSRDQLIAIAALSQEQITGPNIAKLFFLILTQSLTWWKRMRLQWFCFFQATTEELADFLFLTRSFTEFPDFTRQIIEKIEGDSVLLYAPRSKFSNLTLWEYILSEKYFLAYLRSRDITQLDLLVAVLYRPARKDYDPDTHDDIRVPLIDSAVPARAGRLVKIPLSLKLAILMWYDGCRQYTVRSFPEIFPKPKSGTDSGSLADKLAIAKPSGDNWIDLISQLSTTMMDFERIGRTNLSIAFTDISARLKKARTTKKPKPTPKPRSR